MSQWLKAGTAVTMVVGPFVDSTDGYTPVTGLSSSNFDEYGLVKHGLDTDIALATSDTFAAIPDLDGYYTQLLSDTHVNTPGMLSFIANDDSAFLPVVKNFMVIAAVPYDALIADTDRLPAHLQEVDTGVITADAIATDAIGSAELAATAVNEIADQVWDELSTDHVGAGSFGLVVDKQLSTFKDIDSSDVQAELVTYDAATGTEVGNLNDPTAGAVADAVWDELDTDHTGAGSFGLNLDGQISGITASVSTDDMASIADHVWDDLSTDHVGAGSFGLNLDSQISAVSATVDTDDMAGIADHVWDELSTDHTLAGSFGLNLDDQITGITASVSTDDMAGIADHVWDELSTDHVGAGSFGLVVDKQLSSLNDIASSDVNAEVVDVLRTDTIPDSYAADGSHPTIAQAILAIQQYLQERAVSGTTVTVKKPDGSTTAMTLTLDDGTSPTSITRAT